VPARSILAFQTRTVCRVAIKSNGLIYPNNTNFTIAKRHAVTDFIGIKTKSKISDFINRFQIMNPLNKSVSKHIILYNPMFHVSILIITYSYCFNIGIL